MGVPGFFAWILKNFKNNKIIQSSITEKIDGLYIDANCLIHPQCFKILGHFGDTLSVDKLESKMIQRVLNYIDYLIGVVGPRKFVYLAIDGVAPASKISQQRKRRFRTIQDNEIKNTIRKKYKKQVTDIWDNTCITPGTDFMEKLHNAILKHIKTNKSNFRMKYIYSSYHTPGEGEHKILQHIKEGNRSSLEDSYVIYGLDADLIFLAMASQIKNIYLLREEIFFGKETNTKDDIMIVDVVTDITEDLVFVSIKNTKECINNNIKNIIISKYASKLNGDYVMPDNIDFTNDFIFLCYFLGNDFLPNPPSIEIRNDGLDFLLEVLTNTYMDLETPLVHYDNNEMSVNNIFFCHFIGNIAKYEDYYFRVKLPKYYYNLDKRRCPFSDPYEVEIWQLENMKNNDDIEDKIMLGVDEPKLWKYRYYEQYYNVSGCQTELIDMMCSDYLEGIIWTSKYYFEKCPSWKWYYRFLHAPFISDLVSYMNRHQIDINSYKNKVDKQDDPLLPCVQLLTVLSPASSYLLPSQYTQLVKNKYSPIIDLYPVYVVLDMINKDSYHKCLPKMPAMDIGRIINATSKIILSEKDRIKNSILTDIVIELE
jgi:5'-3' exonuclease